MTLLSNPYAQKALLVSILVGIACSQIGIFLVLRKMSLIGDSLAHVALGALTVGVFVGVYPLYLAAPITVSISLFILRISRNRRMHLDAALGIMSAIGVSLAVILSSISTNFTIDLMHFLFGSILFISNQDVVITIVLTTIILGVVFIFYQQLFSITFDESFAQTRGIKVNLLNNFFIILVSLSVIIAIRIVGALLVSALIILPAATALQLTSNFRQTHFLSGLMVVFTVFLGIVLSFIFNLPPGSVIVLVSVSFFLIVLLFKNFLK